MPILKHHKQTGFVQIPNVLAQNTNLSYEALGVLVHLLSRPDDWVVHKSTLRNDKCGVVMMDRIFKELQDVGYLKLITERDNGQISTKYWIVSDEPMLSTEKDEKTVDYPDCRKPLFKETFIQGNQELQIKTNTKKEIFTTKKDNISCAKKPEFTSEFEEAWANYPKRLGSNSKKASSTHFEARAKEGESYQNLISATKNYCAFCRASGNENTAYVMQGQRFYGVNKEYQQFITMKQEYLNNASRRQAVGYNQASGGSPRYTAAEHGRAIMREVEKW